MWFSQLGHILQTIQNRYGSLQLSITGVQHEQQLFVLLFIQSTDIWCDSCDACPYNLDDIDAHLRTHEKTDSLLELFIAGIV